MAKSWGKAERLPGGRRPDRATLIDTYLRLRPLLQRRFGSLLPADLRQELGSVTFHQISALSCIYPEGLPMRDLARALDITDGSATTLADRLVAKGLAERRTDPADRRVVRLVPSPRGASLIERFRRAEREAAEAALGRVDDRALASFVHVLEVLAAPSGVGEGGSGRGH